MNKVAKFLKKSFYVTDKDIPKEIVNWMRSTIGGVNKYTVEHAKKININIPWHESDRVYYALFELTANDAKITSMQFTRSGLESGAEKVVKGSGDIPSGYVMAEAHIHPKMVKIYTADDVQKFITKGNNDLSDNELLILYFSKSLKSFARPIFKDDGLYQGLVKKGLLKSNNSITVDGLNVVEENKQKIQSLINEKSKYYHENPDLFSKLPAHSPFYSLESSYWKDTKGFKYNPSDNSFRSR